MKYIFSLLLGGFFVSVTAIPAAAFSFGPTSSLGAVNSDNGYLSLNTGTGDRAVSSLGSWITGDKYSFTDYGKEGSGAGCDSVKRGIGSNIIPHPRLCG